MANTAISFTVDGEHTIQSLQDALSKLDGGASQMVLDLSSVRQIGPKELRILEKIAAATDRTATKVTLCQVSVDIYKVLKLLKLSSRFSFVS